MGRKPKNPYDEFSIEQTQKTIKRFHVLVPNPLLIDYRPKELKNGKSYGWMTTSKNWPFSGKDRVVKELNKRGVEARIRQVYTKFSELCPRCEERGTPTIQMKSNDTTYTTSGRYTGKESKVRYVKTKKQPWLTYKHGKNKKCWVQRWLGDTNNTFKPKKYKKIDPRKFIFEDAMDILARK